MLAQVSEVSDVIADFRGLAVSHRDVDQGLLNLECQKLRVDLP